MCLLAQVLAIWHTRFKNKNKTYWLLIEANNAAFSRRGSELAIISDSFRLDGMKEENYADRTAK